MTISLQEVILIENFISKNDLDGAFRNLKVLLQRSNSKKYHYDVILIEGWFSDIARRDSLSLAKYQDIDVAYNKIRQALLDILKKLRKEIAFNEQEINSQVKDESHPLHSYPRGPMVEHYRIKQSIIEAFASLIDPSKAQTIVNKAIAFRKEADPRTQRITTINLYDLPPPATVAPYTYWQSVFSEACLQGPRMVAALLHSVSDSQFPDQAKIDRKALLEELKS